MATEIKFVPAGCVSKSDMGSKVVAQRNMLAGPRVGNKPNQEIKKGDCGTLVGTANYSWAGEFGIVAWDNGNKSECPLSALKLA
jgi:hypothetical protein